MDCHLQSHIHLASVGDDLVVLDAARGVYACLPGLGGEVRREGSIGCVVVDDADLAEALAAAGFITATPPQSPPPCRDLPAPPTSSVWRTVREPVGAADWAMMGRAYATTIYHYFARPFAHLIDQAARPGTSGGSATGRQVSLALARRARIFDQLLPWAPFQGECLFRSFMLLMFLRQEGHEARWVFGVQTWPFQAHCWLQAGDTVLDDAAERVAAFTPIFAV